MGLLSGEELDSAPRTAPWVLCAPGEGSRRWRGQASCGIMYANGCGAWACPCACSFLSGLVCLAWVAEGTWCVSDRALQTHRPPTASACRVSSSTLGPSQNVGIGSKFATKCEELFTHGFFFLMCSCSWGNWVLTRC